MLLAALLILSTIGNIVQGYFLGRDPYTRPFFDPYKSEPIDIITPTTAETPPVAVPAEKQPKQAFSIRPSWRQMRAEYESAHDTKGRFAKRVAAQLTAISNGEIPDETNSSRSR